MCKLDFGVQVGGRIVDSAFTIAFNPKYDPAIQCTIDGTNTGLREAGVDARFSEIGAAIQETIESYEVGGGVKGGILALSFGSTRNSGSRSLRSWWGFRSNTMCVFLETAGGLCGSGSKFSIICRCVDVATMLCELATEVSSTCR